jgi:hypothetical protein
MRARFRLLGTTFIPRVSVEQDSILHRPASLYCARVSAIHTSTLGIATTVIVVAAVAMYRRKNYIVRERANLL